MFKSLLGCALLIFSIETMAKENTRNVSSALTAEEVCKAIHSKENLVSTCIGNYTLFSNQETLNGLSETVRENLKANKGLADNIFQVAKTHMQRAIQKKLTAQKLEELKFNYTSDYVNSVVTCENFYGDEESQPEENRFSCSVKAEAVWVKYGENDCSQSSSRLVYDYQPLKVYFEVDKKGEINVKTIKARPFKRNNSCAA